MGSFDDLSDSSQFSQGWQIANTVLYAQEESQFLVYNGCLRMLGCTSSRTLVEGRNSLPNDTRLIKGRLGVINAGLLSKKQQGKALSPLSGKHHSTNVNSGCKTEAILCSSGTDLRNLGEK